MFDLLLKFFTSNKSHPTTDAEQVNDALEKIKEELMKRCDHGVKFDSKLAANMNAYEVKKFFPRLDGVCPKGCGYSGIAYASKKHYVMGDW